MGSTDLSIEQLLQARMELAYKTISEYLGRSMFDTKPFWIDDRDPFDIWVEQVRAQEELVDGINGS